MFSTASSIAVDFNVANVNKAIEHYEKWKHADPGIAEVEDARKRLAGLK